MVELSGRTPDGSAGLCKTSRISPHRASGENAMLVGAALHALHQGSRATLALLTIILLVPTLPDPLARTPSSSNVLDGTSWRSLEHPDRRRAAASVNPRRHHQRRLRRPPADLGCAARLDDSDRRESLLAPSRSQRPASPSAASRSDTWQLPDGEDGPISFPCRVLSATSV